MRETLVGGRREPCSTVVGGVAFETAALDDRDRVEELYDDRFERSHEGLARVVAYLGPYIFWATIGAIMAFALVIRGWTG